MPATMSLGREDTYINVYLPRITDPAPTDDTKHRLCSPRQPSTSPVFDAANVYKFSDQIVKDRKLFLGKKQMSMYDLYYKNGNSHNTHHTTTPVPYESHAGVVDSGAGGDGMSDMADVNDERVPHHIRHGYRPLDSTSKEQLKLMKLPCVNTISLSFDKHLMRTHRNRNTRFNEEIPFCRNRHNRLKRQLTYFDASSNKDGRHLSQEETRMESVSKMFQNVKKTKSAPPVPASSIPMPGLPPFPGLPPIGRPDSILTNCNNNSSTSTSMMIPQARSTTTSSIITTQNHTKTLPLRPSSKPERIWRQTTSVLMPSVSDSKHYSQLNTTTVL